MRTIREMVENVANVDVTVRGEKMSVRRLSGVEQDVIMRIMPQPEPPMIDDPERGSLAPKIPDVEAPAFMQAMEARWLRFRIAAASVGLGGEKLGIAAVWPTIDMTNHASPTVREAAEAFLVEAEKVLSRLSLADIRDIFNAAAGITGIATEEFAVKN